MKRRGAALALASLPAAVHAQVGTAALIGAAEHGDAAELRRLLGAGADVNRQDDIDDSAFLLAGARGHTGIVRAALGATPPPDFKRVNHYGGTALIPACHHGHVDTVRVVLAAAIDINHVNRLGWTALMGAILLGDGGSAHTEIVRLLLAHRADPNLADAQGVSPLVHALQRGQRDIAHALRAGGAR